MQRYDIFASQLYANGHRPKKSAKKLWVTYKIVKKLNFRMWGSSVFNFFVCGIMFVMSQQVTENAQWLTGKSLLVIGWHPVPSCRLHNRRIRYWSRHLPSRRQTISCPCGDEPWEPQPWHDASDVSEVHHILVVAVRFEDETHLWSVSMTCSFTSSMHLRVELREYRWHEVIAWRCERLF